jgi:hypothetical protein
MTRNPSADRTPLDEASFYIEELKYGARAGQVEPASRGEMTAALEVLLRDAGVATMTGAALGDASLYYGDSDARSFGLPRLIGRSIFLDGLMHGIEFAAGLKGALREPKR